MSELSQNLQLMTRKVPFHEGAIHYPRKVIDNMIYRNHIQEVGADLRPMVLLSEQWPWQNGETF